MAAEDSVNNGILVDSSNGAARMSGNGVNCLLDEIKGTLLAFGGDSSRFGCRTICTYKRRKCGAMGLESKLAQLEKLYGHQSPNEMAKQAVYIGLQKGSCEQVCHPKKNWNSLKNGLADCSFQHWRCSFQTMCQSFNADQVGVSGIECCIRDALSNDPQIAQGYGDSLEGQCSVQHASVSKASVTDVGKHSTLASNGSVKDLNCPTVTKQCQHAFFRLTMSEKFASLCKLLSENFHGANFDRILDFSLLNSRMKEGAYEKAPALFLSDIQQLWRKLHVIGIEMVSLSKSLSDMSRLYCRDLEAVPCASNCADTQQQRDDSVFKACRKCWEKSDGRECLICDSCEEIFHVSCIKPAVTDTSGINWYCANCTALGTVSSHENCVVCERLGVPCGTDKVGVSTNDEAPNGAVESSDCIIENGIQVFKGSKRVCCKACRNILENGELFRLCEHHACKHYYHARCLTNKQLKSYCSKWYCPCCLCRVCLTDKDDDKIVLCDACDHAYHIYCMHPPQESIPEGQWYCRKCDSGLQAIRKAKLTYLDSKEDKKVKRRKVIHNTSGGVDMLLSAANAITHQEQLASLL